MRAREASHLIAVPAYRPFGRLLAPGLGTSTLTVFLLTPMTRLRNFGVYRLPDGLSYVAAPGPDGYYYLFDSYFGLRAPPVFEVTADGRVARRFSSGAEWSAEDLEDTGETFADGGESDRPGRAETRRRD